MTEQYCSRKYPLGPGKYPQNDEIQKFSLLAEPSAVEEYLVECIGICNFLKKCTGIWSLISVCFPSQFLVWPELHK